MPEDIRACPLCKYDRSKLFDTREFRGESVVNRLCLNCGLVFQSPRMTSAEAEVFYTNEYRLLYEGSQEPTPRNLMDQRGRAESLVNFARPYIHSVVSHLDIGCSFGLLLQRFQETYQCKAYGVEPGKAHRDLALKAGLQVYPSLDDLKNSEETRFDLVSLIHVLEHLPDPVSYLTDLRETVLAHNGWLFIEVPNLYAHDSFEIAHLVSYSPHSLVQTLAKAGFHVLGIECHGKPRSKILPLYITLLAQPVSTPPLRPEPEKLVPLKRRLGMLRRRFLERLLPRLAWIA